MSDQPDSKPVPQPVPQKDYPYTVDGKPYVSEQENVTGKYIKSKIPGFNPTYTLFLEGQGKDPDQQINDDTTVNLTGHRKFYTVPPATFGSR